MHSLATISLGTIVISARKASKSALLRTRFCRAMTKIPG